jgi:hypothetical protein
MYSIQQLVSRNMETKVDILDRCNKLQGLVELIDSTISTPKESMFTNIGINLKTARDRLKVELLRLQAIASKAKSRTLTISYSEAVFWLEYRVMVAFLVFKLPGITEIYPELPCQCETCRNRIGD